MSNGLNGSAVHVANASVTLRQMKIDLHQDSDIYLPELQPSLLYASGVGSELVLENVAITNNRATQLLEARAGATVTIGYVSSARNSFVSGGTSFPSVVDVVDTATSVGIYSSVL